MHRRFSTGAYWESMRLLGAYFGICFALRFLRENEYIYRAADLTWEPNEENQNRLAAYLAFLENSDEYQDLIRDSDWEEFGRLVNFEAEELDVDVLQYLMKILVSKGAY